MHVFNPDFIHPSLEFLYWVFKRDFASRILFFNHDCGYVGRRIRLSVLAKTISLWIPFSSATQASKTYFYGADQLFHLDKVFYAGLAYFILFVLVYAMGRVIGLFIPLIPTPEKWEDYPFQIASGVLAVLVTYFVLQMGFTILSTIPMAAIQDRLHGSFLIRFMVQYSPLTAGLLKQLWVVKILGA